MGERIYKGCKRIYNGRKFNNIKEIIENTKVEFKDEAAFKFKDEKTNEIKTMSYKDYLAEVDALGTALISLGLKDKRIGVISENRYEWEEAYLASVCGTGVVVPLDKSLPDNEIISLIERSEIEAIFFSSKYNEIMNKALTEKIGNVKFFISMDLDKKDDKFYSQKELIGIGKQLIENGSRTFLDAEIDNDGLSIMLFTSGTTSAAKAVQLSHKNICTNLYDISSVYDITKEDTFLSFLPLHHVFECTTGFLYAVSTGASIAFCEGIRHIADNIKEYQASAMVSVPILFENMYAKVIKGIEKQGKLNTVKFGIKLSKFLMFFGIDIRRKIFKDIHAKFGGKLRLFVAGAAAFDPVCEKGFNDLGIETYQGYGLTEASPVVAAEHKTCAKPGSIGQPFPSLEAKILDPDETGVGELCVKGDSIMIGYYQNKDTGLTEDGWFNTGDLGYIDKDGYIFITGRKKSVIVLKNGKNVFPEELETLLNKIPGVKESFVFGRPSPEDKADLKIGTELVIDKEAIEKEYGVTDEEEIRKILWDKVKEVNKQMPTYKYIKEMILTEEELIKTTTLKIKRFEEIKKVL